MDDLYPRAKFSDALVIIEKLGHTKSMQAMRREWIDEGKPKSSFDKELDQSRSISTSTSKGPDPPVDANRAKESLGPAATHDADLAQPQQRPQTPPGPPLDTDDDLYTATPGAVRVIIAPSKETNSNKDSLFVREDTTGSRSEEEDELDKLLAEDTANGEHYQTDSAGGNAGRTSALPVTDDFQDEMEAMAGMDDMW